MVSRQTSAPLFADEISLKNQKISSYKQGISVKTLQISCGICGGQNLSEAGLLRTLIIPQTLIIISQVGSVLPQPPNENCFVGDILNSHNS
jgi:hypothetical protein